MFDLIKTCPRCTGLIPSPEAPGEHPGATSRVDGKTEICSPCGEDEAIRQNVEKEIVGKADWPMIDAHQYGYWRTA